MLLTIARLTLFMIAQSAEAAEYTDCTSAKRYQTLNECPGNEPKRSDGEVPIDAGALWNAGYSFIAIAPRSTLARSGST